MFEAFEMAKEDRKNRRYRERLMANRAMSLAMMAEQDGGVEGGGPSTFAVSTDNNIRNQLVDERGPVLAGHGGSGIVIKDPELMLKIDRYGVCVACSSRA